MIIKAAIKDADGNIWDVPQPGRHSDIFSINSIREHSVQGFIDETGKFYDRYEAAEHAVACGQQFYCYSPMNPTKDRFKCDPPYLPFTLFSEDLW